MMKNVNITESRIGCAGDGSQRWAKYGNAHGKPVKSTMMKISWICDKTKYLPYDGSRRIEVFGNLGYRRDESSGNQN